MDIHALIGAHKTKKQAPFFFLYNYMEQLLQRGKSSMAQLNPQDTSPDNTYSSFESWQINGPPESA